MTPREAREALAVALHAAIPAVTCYPGTVASPTTPSALLEGAGFTVNTACMLQYTVAVTVVGAVQTITEAVDNVEAYGLAVYAETAALGWQVSDCGAPTVVQIGGDAFLAVQFTATTRLE